MSLLSCVARGVSILTVGLYKPTQASRIWLSSRKVHETLPIGTRIGLEIDERAKTITIFPSQSGTQVVSFRQEGERRTPIIDLKSKVISRVFGVGEKIKVTFLKDRIVISVAQCQSDLDERTNDRSTTFVDVFAGAGTLSYHLKSAGFKPVGALELDQDFLNLYEENFGPNVPTFCGAIQDIDPRDLPKAGVVCAGIPCTEFSQGNIKTQKNLKAQKEGKQFDSTVISKRYTAESLTFFLLRIVGAINPHSVLVEEVEQYSESAACTMLRAVLSTMGYSLSETTSSGSHTKRKRWCLVASMHGKLDLQNLLPTIRPNLSELLDIESKDRSWFKLDEIARLKRAAQSVGVRAHGLHEIMTNSFTTHATRATEPAMKKQLNDEVVFSEFTNEDIAKIHGLCKYKLSGNKTLDRRILGQGVTDMFYWVGKRLLCLIKGGSTTRPTERCSVMENSRGVFQLALQL